jgi:hypothetical protein
MTTTPEPWNFTEAQRRQFREAHAAAKRQQMERDAAAEIRDEDLVVADDGEPNGLDTWEF